MDSVFTHLIARLYQREKREWATAHKKNRGRDPERTDAENFSSHYQQTSIDALRSRAESILFIYAETLKEAQFPEMQREAFNERVITEISEFKSTVKGIAGYKHHIIGHVIGFVVLVCIYYLFTVIVANEPRISGVFDFKKSDVAKGSLNSSDAVKH